MLAADSAPPVAISAPAATGQAAGGQAAPAAAEPATSLPALQARLEAGDCAGVSVPLRQLVSAGHDDNQTLFLLGMASLCRKDYRQAILRFRAILARDPNVVRVRLELARAYYEKGEMLNAQRQFQFARAGHVPPAVAANIDRYLYAIRQKRPFSASLGLAVAPDSNVSSGPSVDTVAVFGLPFKLDPDSKATSGVGLALDAGANWGPALASHLRWDVGVSGNGRLYRRGRFNDVQAGLVTGPRLVLAGLDLALHGNVARRWFGGAVYANDYGVALEGAVRVGGRARLTATGARDWLDYPAAGAQDGALTRLTLGVERLLSPSSQGRVGVSYGWDGAADPAYAYHAPGVELAGVKEFAGGFTANAEWHLTRSQYGYFAAFSARRHDLQNSVQLTVLHRKVSYRGFAPRLSAQIIVNTSNIPAWSFTRKRVELGFTRLF